MKESFCLVIPCYNEGGRLLFDAYEKELKKTGNLHLLFVDDGSKDDTQLKLQTFAQKHSNRVKVLALKSNKGKAEAVRSGITHAVSWRAFKYLGYFDADLATPLAEAMPMLKILEENPKVSIVLGARVKRLGALITRNEWRHYIGRVFATFASLILSLPVYDTQCGAKVLRTSLIPVCFAYKFKSRWLFDIELLARMIKHFGKTSVQHQVVEYPLSYWVEKGDSRINLFDMIRVPFQLVYIYSYYFLKRHEPSEGKNELSRKNEYKDGKE